MLKFNSAQKAAQHILEGGILLYPTETYYAIGCAIENEEAIKKIFKIKKRSQSKTLPIIAANWDQVKQTVIISREQKNFLKQIWPAPLTVILQAKDYISTGLKDSENFTAIRITPYPLTARLIGLCKTPLVGTSANFAGEEPVWDYNFFSQDFLEECIKFKCGILLEELADNSGETVTHFNQPSTIIKFKNSTKANKIEDMEIIRAGAWAPEKILKR